MEGLLPTYMKYALFGILYLTLPYLTIGIPCLTIFHENVYRLHQSTDFDAQWLKRCGLVSGSAFWGGGITIKSW